MHINNSVQPGMRFGKLVVQEVIFGSKQNRRVLCDCGVVFSTYSYNLANGNTWRCGVCANSERAGKPNLANRIDPLQRTINDQWNTFRKHARARSADFISKDEWFSLTQSDCIYCGAAPSNLRKGVVHARDFWYNGIDRIDSSQGYVLGNVQPACWVCNRMKGNMSHEDFLAHVRKIK